MFGIGHNANGRDGLRRRSVAERQSRRLHRARFNDVPDNLDTILIENGNGPGPFGSKGIGEGGLLPVASAIANAVSRAVGVRIQELPLTPPKIWRAMQAKA